MTETIPAPQALLEAALYADDLGAAENFYGTVLGLQRVTRAEGRHVFFRIGPMMLLIFRADATQLGASDLSLPVPPHGATGEGHVCFAATAPEIQAWADRLSACGIAIEADFHWPNGARSIYFRDPAGNSLEFSEPRLWFPDA
ncbi:VOC family protein [Pseudooceanicola sp. CBS1P-1]|uniref:Glyoxalase/bleomycin resistance/extradiol dioxygenase family protein n=1 Tax=Pseudooceanicola albus TaxID=2692189 RepID=A0A6L7GB21_9RHOB|nr:MULTISPECIES: VOC family protein [Pseudooceanicola]MBT9384289.1 VOC family protein [Pseudooceanicola endophyticus]MXN20882.1 glyoxalase/bleomycin resistance/extradiol dioxygenase family protein [Pseudooceanicola albus]